MFFYKHNRSGTRIYYSADRQILDLMRVEHAEAEHPAKYAGAPPLPPKSLEPSAIYARRKQRVEPSQPEGRGPSAESRQEGSVAYDWNALAARVYERRRIATAE